MKPSTVPEVFRNRPINRDTRIIAERFHQVDGCPVCEERWKYEGITGSSLLIPVELAPVPVTVPEQPDKNQVVSWLQRWFPVTDPWTFTKTADGRFYIVTFGCIA